MVSLLGEYIQAAAEIIVKSQKIVALTGAGISADSGIPTFRGKNGLWKKFRPEDLATPSAFQKDPKLVWEWYSWRISMILKAKPNLAHIALAKLEKIGKLDAVITQNVDDLHERAGTKNIIKLHGDILTARCISCNKKIRLTEPPKDVPPRCSICKNLLRPDVVWFGEPLPSEAINRAFSISANADVMIVIGTSGIVYPAGALPYITKNSGGKIIEINICESAVTPMADIFIKDKASVILPQIVDVLEKTI